MGLLVSERVMFSIKQCVSQPTSRSHMPGCIHASRLFQQPGGSEITAREVNLLYVQNIYIKNRHTMANELYTMLLCMYTYDLYTNCTMA